MPAQEFQAQELTQFLKWFLLTGSLFPSALLKHIVANNPCAQPRIGRGWCQEH